MITLSIDEKDTHVLRVSASYLLALAGDISAEITGPIVTGTPMFNAEELAEATALTVTKPEPPATPAASEVFGVPRAPTGAPSIVDAPEAPAATSLTPTPPGAPLPNALTPPSPVGVELDTSGLPWDARIHSRTKSKLANGEWKVARNTPDALIEQVKGELRAVMAAPARAVAASGPVTGSVTPPPPGSIVTPVSPSNSATTFPMLMQKISAAWAAGTLTQEQSTSVVNANGVQSLSLLIQRPDLVPFVEQGVDKYIADNLATWGAAG